MREVRANQFPWEDFKLAGALVAGATSTIVIGMILGGLDFAESGVLYLIGLKIADYVNAMRDDT